jgi:hypothetical protein
MALRVQHIVAVPSPGMYAVITMPLLNRTLATFLSPELGFLGFVVPTRRHTPFISGLNFSAGDVALLAFCPSLHPRRTWLYVARNGVLQENARLVGIAKPWFRGVNAVARYVRDGPGKRMSAEKSDAAIVAVIDGDSE